MPPIRCAIWYALENRADYGDITIVYGARTVADLVYVDELDEWSKRERVRVIRCVDPGGETPDWTGEIGFVPTVFERAQVPAANAVALVIGPPIMIKYTMPVLDRWACLGPRHLHQPGKPYEVWRWQVRSLQLRSGLCVQGRTSLYHGRTGGSTARLLTTSSLVICCSFRLADRPVGCIALIFQHAGNESPFPLPRSHGLACSNFRRQLAKHLQSIPAMSCSRRNPRL